jgi:hypothetical protein
MNEGSIDLSSDISILERLDSDIEQESRQITEAQVKENSSSEISVLSS